MSDQTSKRKKVTIIGDTSKFHLGSRINYSEFRRLIGKKYYILQDIPYDAFGVGFISFPMFFDKLKGSRWWKGIENSDILVVHGEGLTEKFDDYVYPYLYFSYVARELGIESWLVNFSMYEGEPFSDMLKRFSYMACRDILTQRHLLDLGFNPELSFDCCVLATGIEKYIDHDSHVAVIRGRNTIEDEVLKEFGNPIRYNCCWQWDTEGAVSFPSFQEYLKKIKRARFVLSTSFHGNIIAYLSGVPFISLDYTNKKYLALNMELLPDSGQNITLRNHKEWGSSENRRKVYDHYQALFEEFIERAKLNCG